MKFDWKLLVGPFVDFFTKPTPGTRGVLAVVVGGAVFLLNTVFQLDIDNVEEVTTLVAAVGLILAGAGSIFEKFVNAAKEVLDKAPEIVKDALTKDEEKIV